MIHESQISGSVDHYIIGCCCCALIPNNQIQNSANGQHQIISDSVNTVASVCVFVVWWFVIDLVDDYFVLDTFASKVAAINDETADASVGNVQGSNAVNVFLGIGVAWSIAAIYHTANGGQFVVQGGSLGFSVLLFCILAVTCLGTMMWRRFNKNIGAELGGPQPYKRITSIFLAILWMSYIIMSALECYCYIPSL